MTNERRRELKELVMSLMGVGIKTDDCYGLEECIDKAYEADKAKVHKVDSKIYPCAMRYALGRRTYVVDDVCKSIMAVLEDLDSKDIRVMERDIAYAVMSDNLGDPTIDAPRWEELMKALEDELERRESANG